MNLRALRNCGREFDASVWGEGKRSTNLKWQRAELQGDTTVTSWTLMFWLKDRLLKIWAFLLSAKFVIRKSKTPEPSVALPSYLTVHDVCVGGPTPWGLCGWLDARLRPQLKTSTMLSASSSEVLPPDNLGECEREMFDLFSTNSTHFCGFPANSVLLYKKPKQINAKLW